MLYLQICRWEFLAFSGTFKTLLNVHEERDAGRVVFSLIKSSFMKDFEGQWQVNFSFKSSAWTFAQLVQCGKLCPLVSIAHVPLCNRLFWMSA